MLDAALAQLPVDPATSEVIVRTDAAGCSHAFPDACREKSPLHRRPQPQCRPGRVVTSVPESRWKRALSADGTDERESGEVTEVTDPVDLSPWADGTRMIVRREEPHPGVQLTFTDVDGYRYLVFITDHETTDVCFLDALYRGRGRCECRIRDAKDTGLTHLPSASFAMNVAWLALVLVAGDLLVWMKGLCLEGDLARPSPNACATRSCTPPVCWCGRPDTPPCV